jgi:hypothetical protein
MGEKIEAKKTTKKTPKTKVMEVKVGDKILFESNRDKKYAIGIVVKEWSQDYYDVLSGDTYSLVPKKAIVENLGTTLKSRVFGMFSQGGKVDEAKNKFNYVMDEYKSGQLHSSSGDLVTSKDQAFAIAYSEARKIYPLYAKYMSGGSVPKYDELKVTNEAWNRFNFYLRRGDQEFTGTIELPYDERGPVYIDYDDEVPADYEALDDLLETKAYMSLANKFAFGGILLGSAISGYIGYKLGQTNSIESFALGGVLNDEEEKQFKEWVEDGNASKLPNGKWVEQTTQWKQFFTEDELKAFFKKQFLWQSLTEQEQLIEMVEYLQRNNIPIIYETINITDVYMDETYRYPVEPEYYWTAIREAYDKAIKTERSVIDKQQGNKDPRFTIIDSVVIEKDNSGPYATTGTSVDDYLVNVTDEAGKVTANDVEEWAKSLWKSGYMVDRNIEGIMRGDINADWIVSVKTTVWYN